ncbi:hypothetical protein [Neorhodopirellula lusitana]|uniref:hypothetical protein n=1 Tax=Neorhodopirellula lusitana TaxID=445327 RepID=UPI00384B09F2
MSWSRLRRNLWRWDSGSEITGSEITWAADWTFGKLLIPHEYRYAEGVQAIRLRSNAADTAGYDDQTTD